MNIEIRSIKYSGVITDERLVLKVLKDCDIGRYLTFNSEYTADNKVLNLVRHPYWFPDKFVKARDIVVLYTKEGNQSEKNNNDGSTSHFLYRNMNRPIWNKTTDCAVVLEVATWTTKGSQTSE